MKPRFALVVEGGGLRGAFCAGVLETLDRAGYPSPDLLTATSAGAPSAAYLATGQISRAVQLWENRTHAGHLVSPLHWFKQRPLMDIDKLVDCFRGERPLATHRFTDSSPVYISVTNCLTGGNEHLRLTPENAFTVLTATMALPLAYGRTVEIDGVPYIDGGVTDSIPVDRALSAGADKIVVVLTRPPGYQKKRSPVSELFMRRQYKAYPALHTAFTLRAQRYNDCLEQLQELEATGKLSIIRPQTALPASRMTRDRETIINTIQVGRKVARDWLKKQGHDPDDSPNSRSRDSGGSFQDQDTPYNVENDERQASTESDVGPEEPGPDHNQRAQG